MSCVFVLRCIESFQNLIDSGTLLGNYNYLINQIEILKTYNIRLMKIAFYFLILTMVLLCGHLD